MFNITSFSDVVTVAKTFGVPALRYAMDNRTVNPDTTRLICECLAWAANQTYNIESVNDGNIEYTIDAAWDAEKIGGMHITGLNDIRISRAGFGSFYGTAREAMEKGIINAEQLNKVLNVIGSRNQAAEVFGY